jgi:transcriptional regulator with XRE-family HTH domain
MENLIAKSIKKIRTDKGVEVKDLIKEINVAERTYYA